MFYNIKKEEDLDYLKNVNLDELLTKLEGPIDLANYYYFENGLSKEETEKVIRENDPSTHRASTFSGGDEKFRKSDIKWITPDEQGGVNNQWLFEKVAYMAKAANEDIYKFEIFGMAEGIQYTVYDSSEKGFYCKHVDHGKNYYKRKLSVVVQLTDPELYEGGDLLLHNRNSPQIMPKGLGATIVFPSWVLHEVTPVTKGIRRSLVCWISGPPFK